MLHFGRIHIVCVHVLKEWLWDLFHVQLNGDDISEYPFLINEKDISPIFGFTSRQGTYANQTSTEVCFCFKWPIILNAWHSWKQSKSSISGVCIKLPKKMFPLSQLFPNLFPWTSLLVSDKRRPHVRAHTFCRHCNYLQAISHMLIFYAIS